MVRLVDEAKFARSASPISTFHLLTRCEAIGHVDSLQPPSRDQPRRRGPGTPWCAKHDTGVIGYSPMQSGLLTDSFTADRIRRSPPHDWRRGAPEFKQPNLRRNLELRDALGPIAKRHARPCRHWPSAWTLAVAGYQRRRSSVRASQAVDGWIGAASIQLTLKTSNEIAMAIRHSGAGIDRPTAPATRQAVAR